MHTNILSKTLKFEVANSKSFLKCLILREVQLQNIPQSQSF